MRKSRNPLERQYASATSASLIGVVLNVVVDAAVLSYFGLGNVMDAYVAALALPLIARTSIHLLSSHVIQPVFIHVREEESESAAWRFLNVMATAGATAMIAVWMLLSMAAPFVVRLQIPGAEAATIAMATTLFPLMLFISVLAVPIAIMRTTLNGLGVFFLPGSDTSIEASAKGISILFLGAAIGVYALVVGLYLTAMVQGISYYVALRRTGFRGRVIFAPRDEHAMRVWRSMRFPLFGQATSMVGDLTTSILVSYCGTGALAAFNLASRIVATLARSLGHGIVLAAAPSMARSFSLRKNEEAIACLRSALKMLLVVTVPLSCWLVVMRAPIISLVYERMRFTSADVQLVASLLALFVPYILLSRLVGLFELPFYGRRETKPPLMGSLMAAGVYIAIALLLFQFLEIYALPLARAVALLATALFLYVLIEREFGSIRLASLLPWCSRLGVSAGLMTATVVLVSSWLDTGPVDSGVWSKSVAVFLPSLSGGVVLGSCVVGFGLLGRQLNIASVMSAARARPLA